MANGLIAMLVLCIALIGGGLANAGTLRSVNAAVSGDTVTIRIGATEAVAASSFVLAGPERVVVDLEDTKAGIAAAPGAGGVARVRIAQFTPTTARLVLDLSRPMTVVGAEAEPGGGIVLTLQPLDAAGFARLVKSPRRHHAVAAASPAAASPAAASPAADPKTPALPPTAAPAKPAAATAGHSVVTQPIVDTPEPRTSVPKGSVAARGARPLVVIDAGHGGHDTGALSVWGGRREKDVTLAIALAIKRELDASGRVRTVLTRSDDRFLVLAERREVARRQKADLFISIHADSAGNPDAHGATVYTLSDVASDREAAKLAARENKSDIINGIDLSKEASDVSSILIDLARRDTMNVASSFAALLQREMGPYVKMKSEFHRFAGFVVLKAADTPSVLIETGYLSNMEDSRFLFSAEGQKAIAKGVRNAVEAHFARRYRTR